MSNLKIKDLSIGDWVKAGGEPAKVLQLGIVGRNKAKGLSGQTYGFLTSSDIEPIPITPEILKANGWTWDGMYARLRIDEHSHFEYYKHECRLTKLWKGIDEWQNHVEVSEITFHCHCRAVHQLQHALRLAGLNEDIRL